MDCDDVALLLAAGDVSTLTGFEETQLERHCADCETCRELTETRDDEWRWLARVPEEALADRDLLILPTVDPIVFSQHEELARGGMGRISRVHDRRLGRTVAVKEVLAPDLRTRFEREAMITARLQHPAIVPIYEAGTFPDGSAFYTMRLVSGGTLDDAIARAGSLEKRLALLPNVIAMTEALAYAHSRGIIHRDLKPGNVLVGEFGETVVIDWGLAKQLGEVDAVLPNRPSHDGLTRVGAVLGTPGFMSPEQAAGDALDERADVYALGSILYHLLGGAPPYFDEETLRRDPELMIDTARDRPPTAIAQLAPDAPADLLAIVERAMARPKENRYRTAKAMAEELRRFEAGQLLATRRYGLRELAWRWIKKHRTAVIVAAIAIVVLAVVGVMALRNIAQSRGDAERARVTAVSTLAAFLEQQGRIDMLAGDRERALAFLAESYRLGRDSVGLRHMLARLTTDLDLYDRTVADGIDIHRIAFDKTGRAYVASHQRELSIWDGKTRVKHFVDPKLDGQTYFEPTLWHVVIETPTETRVFDLETGKLAWAHPHPDGRREVRFDAAGTRLVTFDSYEDGDKPLVFELASGKLLATLPHPINDADINMDGEVVTTSSEHGVEIWDLATATPIKKIDRKDVDDVVRYIDDKTIVAGGNRVVRWEKTDEHLELARGEVDVREIAVGAGGRFATLDVNSTVRMFDRSGSLLATVRDQREMVADIEFSPDGSLLAGYGFDRRVIIWESASLELRRTIVAGDERLTGFAWGRDGTWFATTESTNGAKIYRAPQGSRVALVDAGQPDLGTRLVAALVDKALVLRDVTTGAVVRSISVPEARRVTVHPSDHAGPIQISRDDRRVLVSARESFIIVDVEAGTLRTSVRFDPGIATPVLSHDGKLVVETSDTRLRVSEADTGRVIFERDIADVLRVFVSVDNKQLVVIGREAVKVLTLPDGNEIPVAKIEGLYVEGVDASGKYAAISYVDGHKTQIMDIRSGHAIATLATPIDPHEAIFDDAGRFVATQGGDRTVRVWNIATGALVLTAEDVGDNRFTFSSDGTRFATGHDNGTVQIYDVTTGSLVQSTRAHASAIRMLAFADGDTRLVAWAEDVLLVLDVRLERRTAAEIVDLAARYSGWIFKNGELIPAR